MPVPPAAYPRTTSLLAGACVLLAVTTACGSGQPPFGSDRSATQSRPSTPSVHPSTRSASRTPTALIPTVPTPSGPPPTGEPGPRPDSTPAQTPGSTDPPSARILPDTRVVAYYGGPDGPGLGVLGAGTPDQMAAAILAQAAPYAPYGRPVRGAMELITQVARSAPGPGATYSSPIPNAEMQAYLDAAHRHNLLLILDIQPGRGQFLPQVQRLAPFLSDPSVSIGLDPEWKVGPAQIPGTLIGSSTSGDINAVGAYLSSIVAAGHLPDKLLIVHEFTSSMLPDRSAITIPPGVEVVFHADGNASPSVKTSVFERLAFPGPPYGTGFKLFLTQDSTVMTPAQVRALTPRPDVITYQ